MFAAARILTLLTLAWGALAFGAVNPWAYWPLSVAAVLSGCVAALAAGRAGLRIKAIVAGVVLFAGAVALQLVPLPAQTLQRLSPATVSTLNQLNLSFAQGLQTSHPISIAPDSTVAGFTIFLACAVLAIGTALLCSTAGVRWIVTPLTGLGVVLSLFGLIQKATYHGKVYGFWDDMGGNPFGPFINRNHFAGWMMMALPLTLGLLCAGIDRGMEGSKAGFRERVLWFGSKAASQLVLLGAASAIMGLALVFTFSRSGIGAFVLALILTGAFVVSGAHSRARRAVGVVYLASLFVLIIGWVGVDLLARQFQEANWQEFGDRRGAWQDARDIASMFPLVGTGFGSYSAANTLYQKHDLAQHFAQAHNDYLQLAAEGGVLLTVPATFLVLALGWHIVRRFREHGGSATSWWVRAGAITGIVALMLQEVVDFSLQMPGNAVLFAVLIGIAIHRAPMPVDPTVKRKAHQR